MNKLTIIIVIVLIVSAIYLVFNKRHKSDYVVPTNQLVVKSVQVGNTTIELQGFFAGSYTWFDYYTVYFVESNLYIKIVAGTPKDEKQGGFYISIPNDYDNIVAVYLQGKDDSDQKLIWSEVGLSIE